MFTEYKNLSKNIFRVSENTVDIIQPSPYQLWRQYIYPEKHLNQCVGIEEFSIELHNEGAIEVFQFGKFKNSLKCKVLNEEKIQQYVQMRIKNPSLNYGIKKLLRNLFLSSILIFFGHDSFAAGKDYSKTISQCEEKLNLKSCEKVKGWCDSGDGRACRAMAGYWMQQDDLESSHSFLKLGCKRKDEKSCEIETVMGQNLREKKQLEEEELRLEQRRAQLENQKRAVAEMEGQQESTRRLQAIQAFSNGVNQMWSQPPPAPKKQRCKTVVMPGNGMDGAAAYYTTECD